MKSKTLTQSLKLLSASLVLSGLMLPAQAQFDLKDLIPGGNKTDGSSSAPTTPGGNDPKYNTKHPIVLKYLVPSDEYWGSASLNKGQKISQEIDKCGESTKPVNCNDLAAKLVFDQQADADVTASAIELLSIEPAAKEPDSFQFVMIPPMGGVSMYGRRLTDWSLDYIGLGRQTAAIPALKNLIETDVKRTNLVCGQKYPIVKSLWWMGDKSTSSAIAGAMENTKCVYEHKRFGAYWLGLWGSKDATELCKKSFRDEKEGAVVAGCMNYLGLIQDKSATPLILRQVEQQEAAAMQSLTLMQDPAAVDGLKEVLAKYSSDNQYLNRIPVLVALAASGHAPAWQELVKKHLKGHEGMTREVAASGVLLKNSKLAAQVKKDLSAALAAIKGNDEDAQLQKLELNSALAQFGDKAALTALVKLLDSSNSDLRLKALEALGGNDNYPENKFNGYGLVGIADTSVIPKLKAFYEVEGNATQQQMALTAALEIQARAKAAAK